MVSSPPVPAGRRPTSLRLAFVLRAIVPLLVVLGGATALTLFTLEREVESRMKEDVELVARGLRLPMIHALERDREGSVSQALRSALGIRRVYGAHVYGPRGERLASFGSGLPDEPMARLVDLLDEGEQVGEYGRTAGRRVYSYFVPLADAWGQNLGVLQLTRRRSDIDDSIHRLRLQAGGFFLLGMSLVSVLVLRGHHRAVGGPLEGLRASMARVRSGDREHRAAIRGPRELSEVSRTFNSMLEAMQRTESELGRRREEQARLRRELAEAEKLAAVGELAGGVAHELGSPLSVIDGKAQRLLREGGGAGEKKTPALAEPRAGSVREIRAEVRRMEAIIRQLLEFGRQETGRERRVGVAEVVRGAVAATSQEARRRGVSVEVEGESPGPELVADPRRLEEALANLLRNACQASEGDGRVRVRWSREGAHAALRVDDDGPGIAREIASRVFEPFFTTKATGEGTGLGLAVVHGVVEGMGGSIELGTSEWGGASFRIRLPVADRPGPGAPAEQREAAERTEAPS